MVVLGDAPPTDLPLPKPEGVATVALFDAIKFVSTLYLSYIVILFARKILRSVGRLLLFGHNLLGQVGQILRQSERIKHLVHLLLSGK